MIACTAGTVAHLLRTVAQILWISLPAAKLQPASTRPEGQVAKISV